MYIPLAERIVQALQSSLTLAPSLTGEQLSQSQSMKRLWLTVVETAISEEAKSQACANVPPRITTGYVRTEPPNQ